MGGRVSGYMDEGLSVRGRIRDEWIHGQIEQWMGSWVDEWAGRRVNGWIMVGWVG